MKTKTQKIAKTFDAVKSMREIRDKISLEIADMDFDQLKAYFKQQRPQRTSRKTSTNKPPDTTPDQMNF